MGEVSRLGDILQGAEYALNQHVTYKIWCPLTGKIHGSGSQRDNVVVTPLIVTPNDSVMKFCLHSCNLGSTSLAVLVPKRGPFFLDT